MSDATAIPCGLCQCGCGQPTKRSPQAHSATGYARGEPFRFIAGHNVKNRPCKSYRKVGRLEQLHRLRAALALGKPLPPTAIVHHADGSRADDAPLVICQDRAYHNLLHARMRLQKAGADPNTHKLCNRCGQAKRFAEFYVDRSRPNKLQGRCRSCCAAAKREQSRAA